MYICIMKILGVVLTGWCLFLLGFAYSFISFKPLDIDLKSIAIYSSILGILTGSYLSNNRNTTDKV